MGKILKIRDIYQANVRSSEGAGTTTLTIADTRKQVFNLSAARTCVLPTTGVLKGDTYILENQASGNFALTVQSSGLNTLGVVNSLYATLVCTALQDAPTSAAHWKVALQFTVNEYVHGTSYNGGNAPTITPGSGTIGGSSFRPFQDRMGNWFLEYNVSIAGTSSVASLSWTLNGILTAANPPDWQSCNGGSLSAASARHYSRIGSSSNNFETAIASNANSWIFDGRVKLSGRPSWAY